MNMEDLVDILLTTMKKVTQLHIKFMTTEQLLKNGVWNPKKIHHLL